MSRGVVLALALLAPSLVLCAAPAASAPATNSPAAAPPKPPPPAKLKIRGYGIFGDRVLKRMLTTLELSGKRPQYFGADFVEDAALILTARIKRDGYLQPRIDIRLTLADGAHMQMQADDLMENPLPRPLKIKQANFKIHKGVLYYFKTLNFTGLETIPEKQALSYFVQNEPLFHTRGSRVYTPERLRQGIESLMDILDRQGYRNAKIEPGHVETDERTGAVTVDVSVQEGRKHIVNSVQEEFFPEGATNAVQTRTVFPTNPYSRLWEQDFTLGLKTNEFRKGYPDTTVDLKILRAATNADRVALDLQAQVKTGPKVWVNAVDFKGEKRTRRSVMARRVRIQRGDLLNPIRVEQGRYHLAELGIFDTVDVNYKEISDHTRDVIYNVKEGKRLEVDLLFGYGSYELLRGGVEATLYNIWGLAHNARLKAVQSFKSSSGEFTYTIPEMVGKDIDLFLHGFGLRREEVSFTREEYGGGVGAHRFFRPLATDVSLRYNYQILNAADLFTPVVSEGLTNPAVGSIITDIKFDRRDNPLYPRRGYKVFSTIETATSYLGGDANYERVELSPSWHITIVPGSYLSFGVSHGTAVAFGSVANNLPFAKRFFPGGENSLRGYQEGEASPRNAQGQYVGAETYTLGTVEFEQALTPKWSLVLFSDSLGFAHSIDHWPFDTGLFSVGGGIRWKTIIGPVRLEYGYNLNPRPRDTTGTLHFSLGYPF